MVQGLGRKLIGPSRGRASIWLLLLVALLALCWWLRESWWHWLPADWQETPDKQTAVVAPGATKPIYAWRDDEGRWNYTDVPPADRPYETRQYREDVNVVPSAPPRTD